MQLVILLKLPACLITGPILLIWKLLPELARKLAIPLQPALIADFHQCARRNLTKAIQHLGHQLSKRLKSIVACDQDND